MLPLTVEMLIQCEFQTLPLFLSGRNCEIAECSNTYFPHCWFQFNKRFEKLSSTFFPLRPNQPVVTSASQNSSRYSTAADALAALVDAAANAPQIDIAKAKESKHERDDEVASAARRGPTLSEQQQQQEAERRSLHSPYGSMSLPGGKPHPAYAEGPGVGGKEKGPQTKSRIEEELRTHGKTTITAANFIDVIITRQIASDKELRERGSQSSDSSGSCECL